MGTVTVRRRYKIPTSALTPYDSGTHYLDPDDPGHTLCDLDAAETTANRGPLGGVWTKAIASCFTCQRVAGERKIGP